MSRCLPDGYKWSDTVLNLKYFLREYIHWYYLFLRKQVVLLIQQPFFLWIFFTTYWVWHCDSCVHVYPYKNIPYLQTHWLPISRRGEWLLKFIWMCMHTLPLLAYPGSWRQERCCVPSAPPTSTSLSTRFNTHESLRGNGESQHEGNTTLLWIISEEHLNLNLNIIFWF